MIRPEGMRGVAFGAAEDGDPRRRPQDRRDISSRLGISPEWAWLRQVHGADVLQASAPGELGEGDAVFTLEPDLPLAVGTADCFPVVLEAEGAVGVAHSGWRGTVGGVTAALREAMAGAGAPPLRAAIGPGIESCCFEVGPEVAGQFPGRAAETTWGTLSVDLRGAIGGALEGLEVWSSGECTMSDPGYHSYRRDRTELRQVALAWLPA